MAGAVQVRGYRELMRSFSIVNAEIPKATRAALREAAWPVQSDTRSKLRRYRGASLDTIGVAVRARGVAVTQRKKKVTGKRPDFGALQMRKGFIPALEENKEEVYAGVELALDELIRSAGFH
jgi:hypothetical protein